MTSEVEGEEIASSLALLAMTRGPGLSVLPQCGYLWSPGEFRFWDGVWFRRLGLGLRWWVSGVGH